MDDPRMATPRPQPLRMVPPSPVSPPYNASVSPPTSMSPPETPSRSDSVTSTHTKRPSATTPNNASRGKLTEDGILEYNADSVDYEIQKDIKLGAGRFSEVYLAESTGTARRPAPAEPLTPPATPVRARLRGTWSSPMSTVYAVKTAVDRGSTKALRGEARILSHLAMDCRCKQYMVPFHGLDPRHTSLVFEALPATLEDLIARGLEPLSPADRSTKLASLLPHIAHSLSSGLAWMHSLEVVHADIKPANILLRADVPIQIPLPDDQDMLEIPFTPVFADFTSSFLTTDSSETLALIGGGTYDYMAPEQLRPPFPFPNFKMDVYALGISLLQVITGCSPFKEAGLNRHLKMSMIKEGKPISWAMRTPSSESRLDGVAKDMLARNAIDVKALLELALRKNPIERTSAEQWSRLWRV